MLRVRWVRSMLGRRGKDRRHAVEQTSADGDGRLVSKNTLKIELPGFGDGFEVRELGAKERKPGWRQGFWPDNCHYRFNIY